MKNEQENQTAAIGPDSPNERRDNAQNPDVKQQPVERPYSDTGNLYEIPPVRADDPPLRHWWMDDEPEKDGSGPRQNG